MTEPTMDFSAAALDALDARERLTARPGEDGAR